MNKNELDFVPYFNSSTKMDTKDFKTYIKTQMNALTCIELSKNIKDTEKVEHNDYLLKNMEFMIKNYREQMVHESINKNSIMDEFHTYIIHQNPSENGHTVKQRLLITKFKEWFHFINVGRGQPPSRELVEYFECKYGKYPIDGWSQFSFKNEEHYNLHKNSMK